MEIFYSSTDRDGYLLVKDNFLLKRRLMLLISCFCLTEWPTVFYFHINQKLLPWNPCQTSGAA